MKLVSGTYTHAESTAKVIEDDPGARVASVIHDVWLGIGRIVGYQGPLSRIEDMQAHRWRCRLLSWILRKFEGCCAGW